MPEFVDGPPPKGVTPISIEPEFIDGPPPENVVPVSKDVKDADRAFSAIDTGRQNPNEGKTSPYRLWNNLETVYRPSDNAVWIGQEHIAKDRQMTGMEPGWYAETGRTKDNKGYIDKYKRMPDVAEDSLFKKAVKGVANMAIVPGVGAIPGLNELDKKLVGEKVASYIHRPTLGGVGKGIANVAVKAGQLLANAGNPNMALTPSESMEMAKESGASANELVKGYEAKASEYIDPNWTGEAIGEGMVTAPLAMAGSAGKLASVAGGATKASKLANTAKNITKATAEGGALNVASKPTVVQGDSTFAEEIGKEFGTGSAFGAGASVAAPAIGRAVNFVKMMKDKSKYGVFGDRFKDLSKHLKESGTNHEGELARLVKNQVESVDQESSRLFREFQQKEGNLSVDVSETKKALLELLDDAETNSAPPDVVNGIKSWIKRIESDKFKPNVGNMYEKTKELSEPISSFEKLIKSGEGSEGYLNAKAAFRLKKAMNADIERSLQGNKNADSLVKHLNEVENPMLEGIVNESGKEIASTAAKGLEGTALGEAKSFFRREKVPLLTSNPTGKEMLRLANSDNPAKASNFIRVAGSSPEKSKLIYDVMSDESREATRQMLLNDVWKEATLEKGSLKNAKSILETRKAIYNEFFSGEHADKLDDLQTLLKVAGPTAQIATASTVGLLTAAGGPMAGVAIPHAASILVGAAGSKLAPKVMAMKLLGSDTGTALIRALRGKTPTQQKQILAKAASDARESIIQSADGNPNRAAAEANSKHGAAFKENGLPPIKAQEILDARSGIKVVTPTLPAPKAGIRELAASKALAGRREMLIENAKLTQQGLPRLTIEDIDYFKENGILPKSSHQSRNALYLPKAK